MERSRSLVVIANMMQRQTFAGVEADQRISSFARKAVPSSTKLGPSRLVDHEGFDVGSEVVHARGRVVGGLRRQRPVAILFYADDFHCVEIDDWPDAFDGSSIAVVRWIAAQEAERPREAAGAFLLLPVISRAPDIDHDQRRI